MIEARRIMVYGVTGSGKSRLAAELSKGINVPWTSVDDLTWEPGWVPVPIEEQARRITEICRQEEWILDSGYSAWIDVPLARVQLIVGLDYPRLLSLGRLLRRTIVRAITRQPVCNGNRESLRLAVGRDSIVRWHFRSFARKRRRMRDWAEVPPGPDVQVLLLTGPQQARRWLSAG